MKILLLSSLLSLLFFSGCSNTWNGVKKDSKHILQETKEGLKETKKSIHEATAE